MVGNPIDFVNSAKWRDPVHIAQIETALQELGFTQTAEIACAQQMGLLGQGWRHGDLPFGATVFESNNHGCWCELYANSGSAGYYIVTASPVELEWTGSEKTIEFIHKASVPDLFTGLSVMTERLPLENIDEVMFAIHVHDRLYQHWKFVNEESPNDLKKMDEDQRTRLKTWLDDFLRFFRPLGFFSAASGVNDNDFSQLVLDYDKSLFKLLPGTVDLCDDFDELADFFSSDQLLTMPASNQQMDIQMLAILDPDRVRWDFRVENYDQAWKSGDVQQRCREEERSALEYTAPRGGNEAFSCSYTILVPNSNLKLLEQKRNWVLK